MSERDFRLYLADILDSGIAVLAFVKDLSFEEFCNDRKTYSAVIREFEVIGEAVGKLPDELKLKMSGCRVAGYKRVQKLVNT